MVQSQKLIYHITHKDNLEGIISNGFLAAHSSMAKNRIDFCDIAHTTIQDRRAQKMVPCGPGGYLHDYVPFYFAPRSPMLFAIHRGNVEGCTADQADIVYLVSSTERVASSGLKFVFTDGHGIMELSEYYDNLDNLDMIDWCIMKEAYWADTDEDPDRKRRRQAEFLGYKNFPLDLIEKIGVYNNATKILVEELFKETTVNIPINIKSGWYY